ncbi:MAG: S41 family peptidase [Clostridiales bacterium]|nr:S41 family peptidase [Clostridiales bacterium]
MEKAEQTQQTEKKGTRKKVLIALVALAIAVVFFFAGFAVSKLTIKYEVSSFEWAMKIVGENYYKDVSAGGFLDGSLKGMVNEKLDIYSAYYTAEEYSAVVASNSGKKSGVGISFTYVPENTHPERREGGILIESVVGNSPAYKSGLRAGEFIESASYSGGTATFESRDDFTSFIDARADGEQFTLNSDRGVYTVAKSGYTQSYCYMATADKQWTVSYNGNSRTISETVGGTECLPDGAAYLRLDQFFGNAAYEMGELIEKFNAESCTSLILDLRGNGGGYVDVMCDISGIFTGQLQNSNPIAMRAVFKDGHTETSKVTKKFAAARCLPAGTKVSVLADNGTASASEALIGVLIDNGVIDYGDIYISDFGEEYLKFTGTENKDCRTYGKGIMQSTFVNPKTGEALKLTTAEIYWPKGNVSIHDVGLNTDMGCSTVPTAWDVTFGDIQLAEAVKAIYGE